MSVLMHAAEEAVKERRDLQVRAVDQRFFK